MLVISLSASNYAVNASYLALPSSYMVSSQLQLWVHIIWEPHETRILLWVTLRMVTLAVMYSETGTEAYRMKESCEKALRGAHAYNTWARSWSRVVLMCKERCWMVLETGNEFGQTCVCIWRVVQSKVRLADWIHILFIYSPGWGETLEYTLFLFSLFIPLF